MPYFLGISLQAGLNGSKDGRGAEQSSLDGLLALSRVFELLRGDLVQKVAQAVLDDIVGDLLVATCCASCALHRRRGQRVDVGDIPQHGNRPQAKACVGGAIL